MLFTLFIWDEIVLVIPDQLLETLDFMLELASLVLLLMLAQFSLEDVAMPCKLSVRLDLMAAQFEVTLDFTEEPVFTAVVLMLSQLVEDVVLMAVIFVVTVLFMA